jgi:hypothetical protein
MIFEKEKLLSNFVDSFLEVNSNVFPRSLNHLLTNFNKSRKKTKTKLSYSRDIVYFKDFT